MRDSTAPLQQAATFSEIAPDQPAWRHMFASHQSPYLSDLTLGLLHKFNNIFTGVMFLMEECQTKERSGEPVGERLLEILTTLREAHTYIDRITQLHLEEEEDDTGYCDLDKVLAGELDLARLLLPRSTTLAHQSANERLTFYASRKGVCQILLHVIANCGEALPKRGGAVSISSRVDSNDPSLVAVEIRDNGPGFSQEVFAHLFTSLCTTKGVGRHAGLGLLRCRELARSYGGELTAANHPEGGATVRLTLPRENSQSLP